MIYEYLFVTLKKQSNMKTKFIILSLLILLLGVQQISAQTSIPDIDINIDDEESSDSNSGIGRNLTPQSKPKSTLCHDC